MNLLPSLIDNYLNDYKIINPTTLTHLCLVKLLDLYLPLKTDFTIEELIDIYDGWSLILSYHQITQLVSKLQLLRIPEFFEPLVLINDWRLTYYVDDYLEILTELSIIEYCYICNRLLLMPSDCYFYVCHYCDSNIFHHSQDNYFHRHSCKKCHNEVTYYIIADNIGFKLSYHLDNYQATIYNQYYNNYRCLKKCRDVKDPVNPTIALNIYQKYNNPH